MTWLWHDITTAWFLSSQNNRCWDFKVIHCSERSCMKIELVSHAEKILGKDQCYFYTKRDPSFQFATMRTFLLLTRELLQMMNVVFSKHFNTLLVYKTLKILLALLPQLKAKAVELKIRFYFQFKHKWFDIQIEILNFCFELFIKTYLCVVAIEMKLLQTLIWIKALPLRI